jgi:hypothetical protein
MNLKIIDNFYDEKDFNLMISATILNTYNGCWQPSNKHFYNRSNAYPCYESKRFVETDIPYKIFYKTFEEKTGFIIDKLNTRFRKIYSNELEHVFKYGLRPHKDDVGCDIAGVIHFNAFSLDDGTGIFSEFENNNDQIEPDIIIGAKPNRCVFYDSQIPHRPLQNKFTEMRIVQPFFIKFK